VTSTRVGLLQICLAGVLWGTGGVVVTVLHERDGLSAMTVSAWRMLIAAVALIGFAVVIRRWSAVVRTARAHPLLVALTGLGTAAYQALYFLSVLMVGVSVSTVVALGIAPLLATAWEHGRARSRPARRQVLAIAAGLAGLVLISALAHEGHGASLDRPVLGLLLALGAGAVYAATTLVGRHLATRVDPVALTTGATATGAAVLVPFLVTAVSASDPVGPSGAGSAALLLYLGVATMALAYGLLYLGLRTTPGSSATIATLLEPVAAAVLAVAVLGERLPWPAWAGGALILVAVALTPSSREPSAHPLT